MRGLIQRWSKPIAREVESGAVQKSRGFSAEHGVAHRSTGFVEVEIVYQLTVA